MERKLANQYCVLDTSPRTASLSYRDEGFSALRGFV